MNNMKNNKIRQIEELSLNAHPGIKTELYDGWILRFANGYTNRANSVNMLYGGSINLEEKIEVCQSRYFLQGLSSVFKIIPELSDEHKKMDLLLDARGYEIVTPTDLMILDLSKNDYRIEESCIFCDFPEDEWLESYFDFEHCTNPVSQNTAKQIMSLIQDDCIYCRLQNEGKTVACASLAIEKGFGLLSHVVVDESCRGKGYGKQLCQSLLQQAKNKGVHTIYLQVLQSNEVAINLYKKLGFEKTYDYWYRVKKNCNT